MLAGNVHHWSKQARRLLLAGAARLLLSPCMLSGLLRMERSRVPPVQNDLLWQVLFPGGIVAEVVSESVWGIKKGPANGACCRKENVRRKKLL